jgi:hypothetical protein
MQVFRNTFQDFLVNLRVSLFQASTELLTFGSEPDTNVASILPIGGSDQIATIFERLEKTRDPACRQLKLGNDVAHLEFWLTSEAAQAPKLRHRDAQLFRQTFFFLLTVGEEFERQISNVLSGICRGSFQYPLRLSMLSSRNEYATRDFSRLSDLFSMVGDSFSSLTRDYSGLRLGFDCITMSDDLMHSPK